MTSLAHGVRRILVGLDGSAAAAAGVDAAVALARAFDAEVIGVHATGLLDVWRAHEDADAVDADDGVAALLRGPWSEALRSSGVAYRLERRDGPPADTLIAVADDVDADLIVVGSRGVGDTALGELGSTSGKIVRRSGRPVLVVPEAT
jgi:nucleotide-binding universal stress UspA family protein